MKINEVIVEGVLGGLAGAAKGLVKGVAQLPGKAVAGYKAGAEVPVNAPDEWKPGVARSKMEPLTQYTKDIGAAIKQGSAGDIGYKSSTDIEKEIAPAGTKIGKWSKTEKGWVNTETNVQANQAQANALETEWDKYAQKKARSAAGQPPAEQPDATTQQAKTLTQQQQSQMVNQIALQDTSPVIYQFGKKGNLFTLNDKDQWVRYIPGSTKPQQPIDANTSTLLDKAAKRDEIDLARLQPDQTSATGKGDVVTQTDATKIASVTIPNGTKAEKWSDGVWTVPEDGKNVQVVDSDVPHLERILAQQTAGKKPHTGGKQKGKLSQTPNAIRQRQTRAAKKQPAVFTSNRRV